MISVHLQSKPFNITVTQVYAPTTNTVEAEVEQGYEGLQDFLKIMPPKCPFHRRGLECKSGSQAIPGVTGKFGLELQNEESRENH